MGQSACLHKVLFLRVHFVKKMLLKEVLMHWHMSCYLGLWAGHVCALKLYP